MKRRCILVAGAMLATPTVKAGASWVKYDSIYTGLRAFIEAQHVFFVATAPASAGCLP